MFRLIGLYFEPKFTYNDRYFIYFISLFYFLQHSSQGLFFFGQQWCFLLLCKCVLILHNDLFISSQEILTSASREWMVLSWYRMFAAKVKHHSGRSWNNHKRRIKSYQKFSWSVVEPRNPGWLCLVWSSQTIFTPLVISLRCRPQITCQGLFCDNNPLTVH